MIFFDDVDRPELSPPSLLPFKPGAELAVADSAAITRFEVETVLIVLLPLIEMIVVNTLCVVLPVKRELVADVALGPAVVGASLDVGVRETEVESMVGWSTCDATVSSEVEISVVVPVVSITVDGGDVDVAILGEGDAEKGVVADLVVGLAPVPGGTT